MGVFVGFDTVPFWDPERGMGRFPQDQDSVQYFNEAPLIVDLFCRSLARSFVYKFVWVMARPYIVSIDNDAKFSFETCAPNPCNPGLPVRCVHAGHGASQRSQRSLGMLVRKSVGIPRFSMTSGPETGSYLIDIALWFHKAPQTQDKHKLGEPPLQRATQTYW